jgi:1-aminocyclopropane-1-carboxylate deaminase
MNDFNKKTSLSIEQVLTVQQVFSENVHLIVKRDDLIHSEISGNKWRKLKYNIETVLHQKKRGILTFGGAFSNHLLATASACNLLGLESIGIVRGEELNDSSNSNLIRCSELGMKLIFVSRTEYSERNEKQIQEEWKEAYPEFLLVPEGGSNFHGMVGCQEIMNELSITPDHIFVSFGTGTTAAGILTAISSNTTLHIVSSLKGYDVKSAIKSLLYTFFLNNEIVEDLLEKVIVHSEFHFGGYGKSTPELLQFRDQMKSGLNLPLDKVYTAKSFYAMWEWLKVNDPLFEKKQTIVFIHTGGLING